MDHAICHMAGKVEFHARRNVFKNSTKDAAFGYLTRLITFDSSHVHMVPVQKDSCDELPSEPESGVRATTQSAAQRNRARGAYLRTHVQAYTLGLIEFCTLGEMREPPGRLHSHQQNLGRI